MFRNWQAICKIENVWLRMLIATAEDQGELLQKLQNAFPEFFSETEGALRIPYSILKAKGYEVRDEPGYSILMSHVLEPFSIPSIRIGCEGDENLPCDIPETWRDVLTELHKEKYGYDILSDGPPRFVEYNGTKHWVAEINEYDSKKHAVAWVTLVPEQFVDFGN
jgi:hypothetical protein